MWRFFLLVLFWLGNTKEIVLVEDKFCGINHAIYFNHNESNWNRTLVVERKFEIQEEVCFVSMLWHAHDDMLLHTLPGMGQGVGLR